MNNYLTRKINLPFECAISRVTDALSKEEFGIISEIDVKEIFKQKIDVDFKNYRILGACNPNFAYKAMQIEDKIGMFLPCNVIVQEQADDMVEVSVMNPLNTMAEIDNIKLKVLAYEIGERLKKVLNNI